MSVANLSKRPDGSLIWDSGWKFFRDEWAKAPQSARVVMEDGRPAIRREPAFDYELPSYVAPAWAVWQLVRYIVNADMQHEPPPPRTKRCRLCLAELKLYKELHHNWVFLCEKCDNREILSKAIVGGTQGQGEKEAL